MEISTYKKVKIFFVVLTPSVVVREKLMTYTFNQEEYCVENCYKKCKVNIQNELLCTKVTGILCIKHVKPQPPTKNSFKWLENK